ncbi:MAG TPA: sodium:proton antiporter [Planctomycetes bacterium]|nr:sodium:proton antiporter [Planctomycetota bacterium]|tara:strand:+ start:67 stop:438 length:372 start_codon:yes stop_codon:yes gene_type:complete
MTALDVASVILLALGAFVAFTSALGVLRLPDFYTRIHPAGKNDSFAQVLVLSALALQAHDVQTVIKLALIGGFLFLTTPSSTYAIARAAFLDGKVPWTKPVPATPQPGKTAKPQGETPAGGSA